METRNLICINCPLGCPLTVTLEGDKILSITGNTCPRGENYARKEVTAPTRTLTTTVRVKNGHLPVVSVRTAADIPREKIGEVMQAVRQLTVNAPVSIGQILLHNAADTNTDIIATKAIRKI